MMSSAPPKVGRPQAPATKRLEETAEPPRRESPRRTEPRGFDPTYGTKIGSDPYDDPMQGRTLGSDPYDDPTRGA